MPNNDCFCLTACNLLKARLTKEKIKKRVKRLFPAYRWIKRYNRVDLIYDIISGLTVGMTVVPQSLAYATIAGLPIQYGLYSSFMGVFLYSIFGTSKDVTYGPTAVISLLVYQYTQQAPAYIHKYGVAFPNNSTISHDKRTNFMQQNTSVEDALKVHYAVVITFICGIIQIVMGIAQLGFLISFISHPVLYGFTNAAAIIIGLGQIKNILGIKIPKSGFLTETLATFRNIGTLNPWDCALGLVSLMLLLFMKKLNRSNWLANILFPLPKNSILPLSISRNIEINEKNGLRGNDTIQPDDTININREEEGDVIEKLNFINDQLPESSSLRSSQRMIHFAKKGVQKFVWLLLTGRNAVIIAVSAVVAYFLMHSSLFQRKGYHISLTPSIEDHIPHFVFPTFAFNYSSNYEVASSRQNIAIANSNASSTSNVHNNFAYVYIPAVDVFKGIGTGFLTISLIAILESLAIAKAFARKHKYTIDSTQEFIALGISNFMSSFVSSYPVTASFSRTAINSQTGVRTLAGGIFTGCLVLLALQFLTQYFKYIPKASLAAMIISAVLNLIEFKLFYKIWKIKRADFFVAITTLIACFFAGVEIGICTGILLSLVLLVFPMSRPHLYINYERLDINQNNRLFYVIKPNQSLFYPSSEYFSERIISECLLQPMLDLECAADDLNSNGAISDDTKIHTTCTEKVLQIPMANATNHYVNTGVKSPIKKTRAKKAAKALLADVIIDCSHISDMDYTIIQEIEELELEFKAMNKEFILCNINEILRHKVGRKNLEKLKIFDTLEQAKAYLSDS